MVVWIPLISAIVAAFSGFLASIFTMRSQAARINADFATELSAEKAIRQLLALDTWPYRTFPMIRHHIGGFEANELRRLLVRAGAVRFAAADGTELWALRERVANAYQTSQWKHSDAPKNKPPVSALFPGAFGNSGDQ